MKKKALIISLNGTKLLKMEKTLLSKEKPWGVILFKRNLKSIKQIKNLTSNIRNFTNDAKFPIIIDEEGEKVSRLRNIINHSVSASFFGNLFKKNKDFCSKTYKEYIFSLSKILNDLGININTIPVLDVLRNNTNKIIGIRSFSKNKKIVKELGSQTIKYLHINKIAATIKHIPGHGLATVDSHHFTPVVNKNLKYLLRKDFLSFKNKKAFFAMTAHIIFNKIDNKNTVTHSKKLIKLIRNKICFKNLLISDDLSMKSLKGTIEENTIKTFNAGCNLALHCNGNLKEMTIVAKNSPKVNSFIIKKTSEFYKNLS